MAERTVGYYLAEAKLAVAYVQSILPFGPGNTSKLSTVVKSGGLNVLQGLYAKVRSDVTLMAKGIDRHSEKGVELMAAVAADCGGGNCQEFAAVAYVYLRDRQTQPVEFMGVYDKTGKKALHAVVVLGRASYQSPSDLPPSQWPGPVVICDPWEGTAFDPKASKGGKLAFWSEGGRCYWSARSPKK